jgi:hypothetical protein
MVLRLFGLKKKGKPEHEPGAPSPASLLLEHADEAPASPVAALRRPKPTKTKGRAAKPKARPHKAAKKAPAKKARGSKRTGPKKR